MNKVLQNKPNIIKYLFVGIVVLLLVLVVIPIYKGFKGTFNPKESIELAKQRTVENGLKSHEDNLFIFYYPSYYEMEDTKLANVSYINPKTKNEVISFSAIKGDKQLAMPTYQYCLKQGEYYREKEEDEIKAEVVSGSQKGTGCLLTVKIFDRKLNDYRVILSKSLWVVGDTTLYTVDAFYLKNGSKDQYDILSQAVDKFTLK